MFTLDLVKITDTSGMVTGEKGKVTYQVLTDDEFDNLSCIESGYSYIGRDFKVELIGEVEIPSIDFSEES